MENLFAEYFLIINFCFLILNPLLQERTRQRRSDRVFYSRNPIDKSIPAILIAFKYSKNNRFPHLYCGSINSPTAVKVYTGMTEQGGNNVRKKNCSIIR
jgi:hypothetical protein